MDVHWCSASVGPEAVIDLLRSDQLFGDLRRAAKERPELCRLSQGEIVHRRDVSLGLHNQGPQPKGSNAVLDEPEVGSVD